MKEFVRINVVCKKNFPVPKYYTPGSSGVDLYSTENLCILPNNAMVVSTGLIIEMPENIEAQIRPRSGLALKHKITVLNSPGTIDSDYRGEIKVLLFNLSQEPFNISKGDRIAQMVFAPIIRADFCIVKSLQDSIRSTRGFGHTGQKVAVKHDKRKL